MPRDAVSRTANVGTVGKNGLISRYIHANVLHTETSIPNIVKRNHIWIVTTRFRLIGHKTKLSLVPNRMRKCYYNTIIVALNKFKK